MAGCYDHVLNDDGTLVAYREFIDMIKGGRDAYELAVDMHMMITRLRAHNAELKDLAKYAKPPLPPTADHTARALSGAAASDEEPPTPSPADVIGIMVGDSWFHLVRGSFTVEPFVLAWETEQGFSMHLGGDGFRAELNHDGGPIAGPMSGIQAVRFAVKPAP